MKKLKVPKFGREEIVNGMTCVTMESKESEIIKLAEKINEIVDVVNKLKSFTGNNLEVDQPQYNCLGVGTTTDGKCVYCGHRKFN